MKMWCCPSLIWKWQEIDYARIASTLKLDVHISIEQVMRIDFFEVFCERSEQISIEFAPWFFIQGAKLKIPILVFIAFCTLMLIQRVQTMFFCRVQNGCKLQIWKFLTLHFCTKVSKNPGKYEKSEWWYRKSAKAFTSHTLPSIFPLSHLFCKNLAWWHEEILLKKVFKGPFGSMIQRLWKSVEKWREIA